MTASHDAAARAERTRALYALASLAFAAYIGGQLARDGSSRGAAAAMYVVILVGSVVLHEVGHAVVAWAVGGRVTGMRLGFGPRLTPAGSWLDLRPLVVAAHVSYVPPRGARRSQLFAVGVAGIVVHLVLIVLALAVGGGQVWARELLLANVLAVASNALPVAGGLTSTSGGPSDGAQLLALLRPRSATVPAAEPPWLVHHRYAAAEALAMVTAEGRPAEARVARAAVAAEAAVAGVPASLPPPQHAEVVHTLALVRLLQGRYEAAGQLAAGALNATAGAPRGAVLATLGQVELALGHRDAAAALLHQAMLLDRGPLFAALAERLAVTPAG